MTRFAATFLVLAFALVGLTSAQEKAKDEKPKDEKKDEKGLKELEGTYKVLLIERDGKSAEKVVIDAITVTIQGDELAVTIGSDEKKTAKIKVAPDAKLSTIELSPQDGTEKGKTFPGIYKIEKNEVTLAFSEKGERPKEFKSDNEAILMRLKKAEK